MLHAAKTILLIFLFSCPIQCGHSKQSDEKADTLRDELQRPHSWAVPIKEKGLPNLHKVTKGLYRGAQPSVDGFKSLKKMGVKTVVNLRKMHSNKDEIEEASLTDSFEYIEIPINTWKLTDEHVIEFLNVANDPSKRPLFFHCKYGADRTGIIAASYRVIIEGWTKGDALEEMQRGGYGFHEIWKNLVRYMNKLDVDKIKKEINL